MSNISLIFISFLIIISLGHHDFTSKLKHKVPKIRHKSLLSNSDTDVHDLHRRSRQNKIINIPNHWEKNPYIFQTYK